MDGWSKIKRQQQKHLQSRGWSGSLALMLLNAIGGCLFQQDTYRVVYLRLLSIATDLCFIDAMM